MENDFVIPEFAKAALKGLRISDISEDAPHAFSLEFTDGSVLSVTAMPFPKPELDVSFVERLDDIQ